MTSGARVIDSTPPAIAKIDLARANPLRRETHRVQSRRAQPVDGDARHRVRQSCEQAATIRATLRLSSAGLVGAAEINLVERGPIHLGMPLHQRLDRQRPRSSVRTLASPPA